MYIGHCFTNYNDSKKNKKIEDVYLDFYFSPYIKICFRVRINCRGD